MLVGRSRIARGQRHATALGPRRVTGRGREVSTGVMQSCVLSGARATVDEPRGHR